MKKYSVIQYWFKGTSMVVKFQSDDLVNAVGVLGAFRAENPEGNYTIVENIYK